jgi:hypothetical protein
MSHQDLIDNKALIDCQSLPCAEDVCILPLRADSFTVNLSNSANASPCKPTAIKTVRQSASPSLKENADAKTPT